MLDLIQNNIDPIIYHNLNNFIKGKNKSDFLVHEITSININEYLNSFIENLTSTVWRTYNASENFQQALKNIDKHILEK